MWLIRPFSKGISQRIFKDQLALMTTLILLFGAEIIQALLVNPSWVTKKNIY